MNHLRCRTDILIVGAGMSGLAAAYKLTQSGREVLLLDKARGVGGRLGNRRFDGAIFDHGAQFMTARDDLFKDLAAGWKDKGIIKEWRDGEPVGSSDPRFRGSPTMSAIAKELGQNLATRLKSPVASIEQIGEEW
ncbi:FAD-dependent oxidoreductase, partial [Opitutales bacterium]|nr:FAD-dependent oxidoreductase [Opitutales bacterium]